MWSWVSFLALVLCFMLDDFSDASRLRNQHPSAAVVVGTVYCDTCFHQDFSKSSHFISGALVAVECGGDGSKQSFREEVKTNEKGEFRVKLPFSISKHVNKIKGCAVKLISSSEPYCAVASTATSSSIRLKSKKPGTNVFSAGFFTFKPLKQPELCNEKPRIKNSKELDSMESTFPPALPDPPSPFLPPIGEGILPSLPLPDLPGVPSLVPPLPRIPGIPIPPAIPEKETAPESDETTPESDDLSNEKTFGLPFPPNPFKPPSLLPPLPFQPPPASILPPNPFVPSPPSLIPPIIPSNPPPSLLPPLPFPPVVPLPSLIPSPPPPPPSFPIPLPPFPPFPFQPSPGFPGVPPASSSSKKTSP